MKTKEKSAGEKIYHLFSLVVLVVLALFVLVIIMTNFSVVVMIEGWIIDFVKLIFG
jgi:hypothetical protein